MDKSKVVDYLCELGKDAQLIDGVVIVFTDIPMPHNEKERIRNILRSVNFRGSWGWRVKHVEQ